MKTACLLFAFLAPSIDPVHEPVRKTVLEAWRGDFIRFLHVGLPKLLVILVFTVVMLRVARFFGNRLRAVADRAQMGQGMRKAQIKTLASILETGTYGVLVFLAIVHSLQVFDFNVTPLLASAGVAGVAIGFGAQTIVHDVINGGLLLLENQFNVGDTVKISGLTGTVEQMSLRKTTLRDGGDGTLYIVPNSQITTVSNLSRDWNQIQVNLSVDFREDSDRVIDLLKKTAKEIGENPRFKPFISGEATIPGIDSFKGSEVIYPVIFKTNVGGQWDLSREFRRKIKQAFMEQRMLLGDPNRVFNYPAVSTAAGPTAPAPARSGAPSGSGSSRESAPPPDPTSPAQAAKTPTDRVLTGKAAAETALGSGTTPGNTPPNSKPIG